MLQSQSSINECGDQKSLTQKVVFTLKVTIFDIHQLKLTLDRALAIKVDIIYVSHNWRDCLAILSQKSILIRFFGTAH